MKKRYSESKIPFQVDVEDDSMAEDDPMVEDRQIAEGDQLV